jgi:anti-sigma B factor antagonist
MAVQRRQFDSVVVLGVRGSFYGDTETDELQKAVMDEAAAGNTRLVLDLSECTAMNSIAIGVLMRGYANYTSRGGEIKLVGLGKKLKNLFVMTRLIMLFDHHDTTEQAIQAFTAPPDASDDAVDGAARARQGTAGEPPPLKGM